MDSDELQLKSPGVALWLSLGITLGSAAAAVALIAGGAETHNGESLVLTGIVIGTAGLTFGPSAGHFYAGDTRRGVGMGFARLGIFAGAFGLSVMTIAMAMGGDEGAATAFLVSGIGAGLTGLGLAIWDIAAAPGAARRVNERLREKAAAVTLGPLVTDAVAGERGYGLALGGKA